MKSLALEPQNQPRSFSPEFSAHGHRLNAQPFRYSVLDHWLHPTLTQTLNAEFLRVLKLGLSESYDPDRFCRQGTYDAYSYVVPSDSSATSQIFYGKPWFDFVQNFFGAKLLPYSLLAYHHHQSYGRSGIFHNDFDIVNFKPLKGNSWGLHVWNHEIPYLRYTPTSQDNALRVRRAIAVIYYLSAEGQWSAGMGGETGLYAAPTDSALRLKVAPLHNRLLIFENSQLSYHRYEANSNWDRNCIIQWFHAAIDQPADRVML